jgi:mitogen-activated protein kinase kinase kinase 19
LQKGIVKLADFGCTFNMTLSQTKDGLVEELKGSLAYMAPEAMNQSVLTRKSDIWSLGCTLLELCTGKQPWSELNIES